MLKRFLIIASVFLLITFPKSNANAGNKISSSKKNLKSTYLSIYANLFTVVKEIRSISLSVGANSVKFSGLDNNFIDDSLHISVKGEGARVLSRTIKKYPLKNNINYKDVTVEINSEKAIETELELFYLTQSITSTFGYKAMLDYNKFEYDLLLSASIKNGSLVAFDGAEVTLYAMRPLPSEPKPPLSGEDFCHVCHPTHMPDMGGDEEEVEPHKNQPLVFLPDKLLVDKKVYLPPVATHELQIYSMNSLPLTPEYRAEFGYEFHNEPKKIEKKANMFLSIINDEKRFSVPFFPGRITMFEIGDKPRLVGDTYFPYTKKGDTALIELFKTEPKLSVTKNVLKVEKTASRLDQYNEIFILNKTERKANIFVRLKRLDDFNIIDNDHDYVADNKNEFHFVAMVDKESDKSLRYTIIKKMQSEE